MSRIPRYAHLFCKRASGNLALPKAISAGNRTSRMLRESRFGEASHGPGEAFAQKGLSPDAGRETPCALSHRVGNQALQAAPIRSPQVHEPACGAGPFSRLPCMCIRTLGTLACLPSRYGRPAALSVCACARGRRTGKRVGKRVHLAEHRHDFLETPDKAP